MVPSSTHPNRILMLSAPRSASNLLMKMLSKQPNHDYSGYYNLSLALDWLSTLDNGPSNTIPAEELESRHKRRQENYEKMLTKIGETEKTGRKTLMKENFDIFMDPMEHYRSIYPGDDGKTYVCTTPGAQQPEERSTFLTVPDWFLLTFQPVFTMRHPAVMYPSLVRAWRRKKTARFHEVFETMTLRWPRQLYDFYVRHNITPIVLDGSDVIGDPECVPTLCRLTGMDPGAVVYEWDTPQKDNAMIPAFRSTIDSSKGVIKSKVSSTVDLDEEKPKWTAELGEEWANELEKRIKESMPDYEWLYERRMQTSV